MTPRTSRLVTLATAAIVFTAIAAVRPLHAEPPTSPCTLLTPQQIKTALSASPNTPALIGKPGTPSDGTVDCTWPDAKGETRIYLSLKEPGITYNSFRNSMQATGRLVPVSGLAADAFYISSSGNSAALYVLKGKHLLLVTVDGVGFTKAQNEAAERTLATDALPKL
ncbi:MAG: hypothetical protein HIU91_12595 [Acidobacteria bacterium]|nr:hypothetical protein [Acidobacteriota bacterium]